MCALPRRAGWPATSTRPLVSGWKPRITRIRLVFPAPFAPRTVTNSPALTARSSSAHSVRAPKASEAPVSRSTGSATADTAARERGVDRGKVVRHPARVVRAGRQRLGHEYEGDAGRLRGLDHLSRLRPGRLGVADEQLHVVLGEQFLGLLDDPHRYVLLVLHRRAEGGRRPV